MISSKATAALPPDVRKVSDLPDVIKQIRAKPVGLNFQPESTGA